jgi:hypothetical protein
LTGAVLYLCVCASAYGAVIDRIAVTVEKQVITESDLITDLRVDAFIDRKAVDLSPAAKKEAAVRLVDQILILREAADSHLDLGTPEDGATLIAEEKSKFSSEEDFRKELVNYRITEADLGAHLLNGWRALRFTDARFRPEVQLSDAELREYYDNLVSSWRKGGRTSIPTFEESREQVEKLATEDRILKALDMWLSTARDSKEIQYREAVFK